MAPSASARLVSERGELRARLGEAAWSELTYAKIFADSPANTTPVIVEAAGVETVVVNLSDSCALGATGRSLPVVTWGDYFDWNQDRAPGAATFPAAVRGVAGPGLLTVGPDLTVSRFTALAATGPVQLASRDAPAPVHVYRKPRAEIEAQWEATRQHDGAALSRFVAGLRRADVIEAAMAKAAVGFGPLDALAAKAGLAALIVTSPYNVELFSGLPAAAAEEAGIACLFLPGAAEIVVTARVPLTRGDFRPAGCADRLADALSAAATGRIGFEGGHLTAGRHAALADAGLQLCEASAVLRRWQDLRAGTDLAYFIVAANAVIAGFGYAADHIARRIGAGLTEREAGALFDSGAADFAASVGFADRLAPSFDIIHSGERTLLPAIAGDHPLLAGHATIKFDMGLLVKDAFGCVRACSDIARTWTADAAILAAHDDLRLALIDRLIPAMRPGQSGAEIHALGVAALRTCAGSLDKAGLLPAGLDFGGYTRDCGHSLHRTTAGSVYFLPAVTSAIEPGMLGCVEFVWPIGDRVVAVEDAFYVTESEVVPLTA